MQKIQLGQSGLHVTPICLGTMTFGEQVTEADSHAILSRSLERGVNFIDTAEMYSVPARQETYSTTETIIGNWLSKTPGARDKLVLATKVAGPSRGMPWVREGAGMTADDIVASCNASLKRLQTDVIDLYQIHWPERHVPAFGIMYYDPKQERTVTSIHEQLDALGSLVKAGKVRAIGLSNESPYGVHEFVRLAAQPHGGKRSGRDHAPPGRFIAGLFAAGLWPADRQVRRAGHRRPGHAARCARGQVRVGAQAALGSP
jgi:aryl-alcohol dehydrogenase-like predicted oxidoreductase